MSTAVRLRELHPNATIVVLESERVGAGASGRNAGFLSPLAAPIWLLAREHAWGATRINAEVHAIARWIREHLADCELEPAKLALQAQSRLSDAGVT